MIANDARSPNDLRDLRDLREHGRMKFVKIWPSTPTLNHLNHSKPSKPHKPSKPSKPLLRPFVDHLPTNISIESSAMELLPKETNKNGLSLQKLHQKQMITSSQETKAT